MIIPLSALWEELKNRSLEETVADTYKQFIDDCRELHDTKPPVKKNQG